MLQNVILSLIFPRRCVGCGRVGKYICVSCQHKIKLREQRCPECDKPCVDGVTHPICRRAYGLDGLVTVFYYDSVIKKAIKLLKYRFVYDTAQSLIEQIPFEQYFLFSTFPKKTVIFPLPLHKDRLRWRGFNQAEKLAQFVSMELSLSIVTNILERIVKRTPQADIAKREDRIKNAQGLFKITSSHKVSQYPSILLFDDVWTTGATMKEATKILKRAGVKTIWGLTLAR